MAFINGSNLNRATRSESTQIHQGINVDEDDDSLDCQVERLTSCLDEYFVAAQEIAMLASKLQSQSQTREQPSSNKLDLVSKVFQLENDNHIAVNRYTSSLTSLREQQALCRLEIDSLFEECRALDKELKSFKSENTKLRDRESKLTQENEELRKDVVTLLEENEKMREKQFEEEFDPDDSLVMINTLKSTLQAVERDLRYAEKQLLEKDELLNETQSRYSELLQHGTEWSKQISELELREQRLSAALISAEKDHSQTRQKMHAFKTQLKACECDVEKVKVENLNDLLTDAASGPKDANLLVECNLPNTLSNKLACVEADNVDILERLKQVLTENVYIKEELEIYKEAMGRNIRKTSEALQGDVRGRQGLLNRWKWQTK